MADAPSNVLVRLSGIRDRAVAGEISPAHLASAFGWDANHVREREISIGTTTLNVGRGYLGTQPAALFAVSSEEDPREATSLDGAALYGYHAAVRWGVLADKQGLTVFNSHWTLQDRWFSMPTVPWRELERERNLLEAFYPPKLADGVPDRIALQRQPNPSLLQPVDDELVERLDAWRDEALKSSSSKFGVDEQLQTLFAKLFVLRTIEDRNLAPKVTPLRRALRSTDTLDSSSLAQTFEQAQKYIGSELFNNVDLAIVPEYVTAGIIEDLYVPRRIPGASHQYNFAWIDSDVLGLAYEKYLSTILHPLPPTPQLDMFRESHHEVKRISVRRAGGVYYTPPYLTKYLANKCVDEFLDETRVTEIPKVVDFACGSGSFLVAATDTLLNRLKERDPDRNWGRELIEGGYINGIDIDEKAVTVARLSLWIRLTEERNPLPLPDLSKVIVQGDGLDVTTWGALHKNYDIVLGNPPFLATARVANRENLEVLFDTAKGRYDYSYLFVEQAIRVTGPNGILGMVVPNRLFRNRNGEGIRELITHTMNIKTIVDFGANEVFRGTSAYVGCIVAVHHQILSESATTVKVVDVVALPEQFVAAMLLDAEAGNLPDARDIRVYDAQHPRGKGAWILLSNREKRAQIQLSEESVLLSTIAGVFQGIRTGANDIFILEVESEDDHYGAQVTNGLGDTAVLELDLLQPVIYGAEVRKYDLVQPRKYLLYPYANGTALSEGEIELRYPQTYRYLLNYRDILSARTSIMASGLHWYELVRRRDEDWLRRPKLLIRDLAPETSFAIDDKGRVFIVGGTAVIPEQEELLFPLLGYLNSSAVNALVRRTTPQFRGSFQKFEPQHLQKIPVLKRLIEDNILADQIGEAARELVETANPSVRFAKSLEIDKIVIDTMADAGIKVAD